MTRSSLLDHPLFHWLQIALMATAAAWAAKLALDGRSMEAVAMAAVAAFGGLLLATPRRFAASFRLLLLAAAMLNAAGYVLGLWVEATPFDEIVHALTSFAGTAAIAWLLLGRTRLVTVADGGRLVWAALAVGVAFGLLWEAFEWLVGMIGSREDTLVDLAMDSIGALGAGLFCAWAARLRRAGIA